MASTLGGVVEFLGRFGLFDVILPFLLVFTIVFAVLEKTRILGAEGDKKTPKSNLNAMVSLVFALLFIAATKLVQAVNMALPYVVVLLIMFICVLLLVAAFYKEGEFDFFAHYAGWKTPILIFVVVCVLGAFLFSLGWLNPAVTWISRNWDSTAAAAVFFGILMLVLIFFIVKSPKPEGDGKAKEKSKE
jgi:hypothetical protein